MTLPSNPTIVVQNSIVVSQLECKEILHRLEECSSDVKMGLPITESDLDIHLSSLVKLVTEVVMRQQPSQKIQEVPI
jgi:hypothetical protein